jgi:CBS domain-containing protein
MTPFPYSVEMERHLDDAREMMARHDFHHLPVTRGGDLAGVVSERDIMLAEALTEGEASSLTIAAVYTADPYVVDIVTPLRDVVSAMATGHISSALVTRQGKLVGIVTYSDIARLLAELLDSMTPPPDDIA